MCCNLEKGLKGSVKKKDVIKKKYLICKCLTFEC